MSFISAILQKNLSEWDFTAVQRHFGGTTKAGVPVNEHTAMRHITVQSCLRVRAETLSSFPLSVYRKHKNGKGRDEVFDHPVHQLIKTVPNDEMVTASWLQFISCNHDISGNGYALITTNKRGQVMDLYPWVWDKITPRRNPETDKLEYQINDRGKTETLPKEKVLHIPNWYFDGVKGYSDIHIARESVGLGMAISEFISRFYGQGMNIGAILETEQSMGKEDIDRLKEQLITKGSGLSNAHMPLVLHNGLKFNRIPMPLNDAQFIETYKLNRDEICGLLRVPPHLVANLEKATFSNIEHQSLDFIMFSMLPTVNKYEQIMNWKLFTKQEREQGFYVKFNLDALLRGDAKSRAEALAIKRRNGVINADEWRELDDQNPIGGIVGTTYFVGSDMMAAETAAKQLPKQQQPDGSPGKDVL
ncbi:phage portal protein [Sporomusa sphaeroides DSM 2875]|uniref:phage portal protein n=1 Tax=Sporomusa sphaeroides TaxID=47679 RepID=UPI002030FDB2|nr:phage portal protein [Sporomusa sphaeroides]MCM0760674.1 phage portal protein [Sporomusa sphaeroides DSM 2875]